MVIGKAFSEKLTKLILEAMPDVCSLGWKGEKMSRALIKKDIQNLHSLATYSKKILYLKENLLYHKTLKVVKSIFPNFLFSELVETKWLHRGKECNRPVFSQNLKEGG